MDETIDGEANLREPDAKVDALVHAIIGAAIEVHRILGPGFLESVYESALCIELGLRGISFVRQASIAVDYKGKAIGESRLDLQVEGQVIVELKAVESLLPIHKAQLISYLKAMRRHIGLLININVSILKDGGLKRVILS